MCGTPGDFSISRWMRRWKGFLDAACTEGVIGAAAGMIAAGATGGLLMPAGVAATMSGAMIGAGFGSALQDML